MGAIRLDDVDSTPTFKVLSILVFAQNTLNEDEYPLFHQLYQATTPLNITTVVLQWESQVLSIANKT